MKGTFLKLHLSILLAGATGVFGKLISLNEGLLVWYRLLVTSVLFFLFLLVTRQVQKIAAKDFLRIAFVGCLLALHWVFFYGSIKASNVSVGVICFSLVGLFTALLEPLIFRQKFSVRELMYSVLALVGVMLIFSLDIRYRMGIFLGIISSLFAALFTISTRRISKKYPAKTILQYEMLGGFLLISCLLPFYLHIFPVETIIPGKMDIVYLLFFVIFCTIGLQLLQIQVLSKLSAFTVNLSYNLEPVYSIILAMILFNEARELSLVFYVGIFFIILSVFLQTNHSRRQAKLSLITD